MHWNKKVLVIVLLILIIISCFIYVVSLRNKRDLKGSIEVQGLMRTYYVHIPPSYDKSKPTSLVIVLHGGGGSGRGMERLTGFNELADKEGFIVVYPDAIGKHWNDGRKLVIYYSQRENVDDVRFISMLIDQIVEEFNIDRNRVYVTGISNGALMSYRLACELSDRIAAIAAVACPMSVNLYEKCSPISPVSVLIIEGSDDPLVPWDGGEIHFGKLVLGEVVSVEDTLQFWVRCNNCTIKGNKIYLPDTSPQDGTRVWVERYINPDNGVEVVLYGIIGGGHTWPGGYQYLPVWMIGRTCIDIDATMVIWNFFESHPKQR